ncbi:hypothetical protein BBF96_05585 [Anoxybacter fermentans]|uniref:Cadherin domain-containing protein n=1 Tax=Anoxybacter fermentans TaxID=1323375 RepID=A0A3S9SX44_9FIRM|nr:putative Ig domain-containing protein [Anoxybacter fermentans]AZR72907.1 hypothetical protein BBF96_05585 [Anoxybacter fermentans]
MFKRRFLAFYILIIGLALLLNGCFIKRSYTVSGKIIDQSGEGISDVTITASGETNARTKTDNSGYWKLSGLKGTVTITPSKQGWVFEPIKRVVSKDDNNVNFTGKNQEYVTEIIVFEDSNLEKAVRKAINKPVGSITKEDVKGLDSLDASVMEIKSLKGIENLTALTRLNLSRTGISDISNLSGLTNLKYLYLSYNEIKDITVLSNLKNLQEVNLSNNQINNVDDLVWLAGKSLTVLNLGGNLISDIQKLSKLTTLEKLMLNNNNISDISALSLLTNLKELDLCGNQITSISALDKLKNLEKLNLSNNQISDITELVWQYDNLKELDLSNNQINNLLPLTTLISLEKLNLSNNSIINISDLSRLTSLKELDLSDNQIKDISGLANLTNLEKLYLHNNQITDISVLLELINLKEVTLMGNEGLNLAIDSVIQTLINRGVTVLYKYNKNEPPVIATIGDKTVKEAEELTFTVYASDPDNDDLTFSVSGDLTDKFDVNTQTFSWTPTYDDAGSYTMTFTVSDGNVEVSETITITVINVNRPPEFDLLEDKTVNENERLTFSIAATDPDGEELTYNVSGDLKDKVDLGNLTFDWTPTYDDAGSYTLTVNVSDGQIDIEKTITITVNNVDRAPILQPIGDKTINETETLSFTISATDPDGDGLTYTAVGDLVDKFDPDTQTFNWTTGYFDAGTYTITFTVTGSELSTSETITITVNNVDRPPVLNPIGNKTVDEYSELSFVVTANDPDNEPITYSVSGLPSGATINSQTGEFSWTPTIDDIGTYTATFTAASNGAEDSETITIEVKDVEFAPVLDPIGDKTAYENEELTFTVTATDLDQDPLTYSVSGDSKVTDKFDPATQTFSWIPTYNDEGTYTITFEVRDNKGNTDSETITITVIVDHPPVLDPIGDKSVDEYSELSFIVTASDPDGDPITYSVSGLPSGATINSQTGEFSWTPTIDDIGTYTATFTATSNTKSDSEIITIVVNDVEFPPVLDPIGDKSVNENEELTFTVTATDLDQDLLTYSVSGDSKVTDKFDPATQTFSWIPTYDDAGTYTITFKVSDGKGNTDSETITITVNNVDRPPVLSTIGDKTVDAGQGLSFTVTANDPDGDPVTYSAAGLPQGATFDTSTGSFSWTPTIDDLGSYTVTFTAEANGQSDSETITINVYGAKLEIIDLSISATTVEQDDTATASITVKNNGNKDAGSFDISWDIYQNGSLIGELGLDDTVSGGLAVGAEITVQKTVDGSSFAVGTYELKPVVDPTGNENGPVSDLSATFSIIKPQYTLTVNISGQGTVEKNPDQTTYEEGTDVTLTAKPAAGWFFDHWEGGPIDTSTTNPETVTMNSDITVTAVFTSLNLPNKLTFISLQDSSNGEIYYLDANNILVRLTNNTNLIEEKPQWHPYKSKILFEAYDTSEGNSNIYVVDADGSNLTRLTSDYANEKSPVWAPGGDKIAFVSDQEGNDDIYVMNEDGTSLLRLTLNDYDDEAPTWSPEGSYIAYVSQGNIWKIKADGSNNISLTGGTVVDGVCANPKWSPDGTKIVFEANGDIWAIEFNGSADPYSSWNIVQVTTNIADDRSPSWSPDGSMLAFISKRDGGDYDIYTISSVGSIDGAGLSAKRLTESAASDLDPVWSIDGTMIAFVSDRDGEYEIFVMDKDGLNEWQVTYNLTDDSYPVWGP